MLSDAQIDHFRTFGFVVLRNLLPDADMDAMCAEVDEAMTRELVHMPFDGTQRHWLPLLGRASRLTELTESVFHGIAEQLYGPGVVLFNADANRYTGNTPWHPDVGWHPDPQKAHSLDDVAVVKFAMYLEGLDADDGALRLVPGSHLAPTHYAMAEYVAKHRPAIPDVPHVVCTSAPGDVVAFDWRMWHASVGGSADRRMATVNFFRHPSTPSARRATLAKAVELFHNSMTRMKIGWLDYYEADWIRAPEHAHLVDPMRELGLLDAAPTVTGSRL